MTAVTGQVTVGTQVIPVSATVILPGSPRPVLVGNTIPNQASHPGNYDAGLTQAQGDTKFCEIAGIGPHLPVTKKFWPPSGWSTTANDLANYAAFGTTVILCLWPDVTNTLADRVSLHNFLTVGMPAVGITGANSIVVLMQEPTTGKGMPPSLYQGYYEFYGPIVNAAGFPLVADIGTSVGPSNLVAYGDAAVAAMTSGGVKLLGLAQDFYCPQYVNGGARLGNLTAVADAAKIGFGVFEHGCVPSVFTVAECTAYLSHIYGFMTARRAAGGDCLPCLYYNGQGSPTGAGDLTSPIGQDPSVAVPDFRIKLWRDFHDAMLA